MKHRGARGHAVLVIVTYERWAFTRCSNYRALTEKFGIMGGWLLIRGGGLLELLIHGGT